MITITKNIRLAPFADRAELTSIELSTTSDDLTKVKIMVNPNQLKYSRYEGDPPYAEIVVPIEKLDELIEGVGFFTDEVARIKQLLAK